MFWPFKRKVRAARPERVITVSAEDEAAFRLRRPDAVEDAVAFMRAMEADPDLAFELLLARDAKVAGRPGKKVYFEW
jgi:hypothetical protein